MWLLFGYCMIIPYKRTGHHPKKELHRSLQVVFRRHQTKLRLEGGGWHLLKGTLLVVAPLHSCRTWAKDVSSV